MKGEGNHTEFHEGFVFLRDFVSPWFKKSFIELLSVEVCDTRGDTMKSKAGNIKIRLIIQITD